MNILRTEVDRYNREYVNKNRAFGELGHPENPTINLDRVSHMITSLSPDGNNFMGKAKILDTPNGKIVKSLLDGGANLGVSTRGVGSLKPQSGFQMVQDDFHLATAADIVADPGATNEIMIRLIGCSSDFNSSVSIYQFSHSVYVILPCQRSLNKS